MDQEIINEYLKQNQIDSNYYAIHIRRGDYVDVASKLIYEKDIFESLHKLFQLIKPLPVLIISDSEIDSWFKEQLAKNLKSKIICIGPSDASDNLCHDLLRGASLLVTSNSTFSLTAALLSYKKQLSIIPNEFYGGHNETSLNNVINKLTKFSIVS